MVSGSKGALSSRTSFCQSYTLTFLGWQAVGECVSSAHETRVSREEYLTNTPLPCHAILQAFRSSLGWLDGREETLLLLHARRCLRKNNSSVHSSSILIFFGAGCISLTSDVVKIVTIWPFPCVEFLENNGEAVNVTTLAPLSVRVCQTQQLWRFP